MEAQHKKPLARNEVSRDPAHWRWGVFYYNPADRRIFPPKKNPAMGWTVNFANRRSVLALMGLMLIPGLIWGIVLLAIWLKG